MNYIKNLVFFQYDDINNGEIQNDIRNIQSEYVNR